MGLLLGWSLLWLIVRPFATVAENMDLDLPEVLTFELCIIPPALFGANDLPREAQKSNLAVTILFGVLEIAIRITSQPVFSMFLMMGHFCIEFLG